MKLIMAMALGKPLSPPPPSGLEHKSQFPFSKHLLCLLFCGTIQRRLAWPLHKDEMKFMKHSTFVKRNILFIHLKYHMQLLKIKII